MAQLTVEQIKEIVENASCITEIHDLTDKLEKVGYSDSEVKEIAEVIIDRLVEMNGG